jgi:hypothetical protein
MLSGAILAGAVLPGAVLPGLAGALAPPASCCVPGLWPGPAAASKALHVLRRSA